ncbi:MULTISPECIES: DUF5343 domain-containing protein [unclassified Sphingomonas]|uniref:DUF5343 domain-containing protein n=1 Tax=unclassified Sphingomonas TaxID=196159 RepID=UPI0012E12483|nr:MULTISPECIES: DUF5343 domain-containing protein [unclassified Sphingomonas]
MANLPYVTSAGNVTKALNAIAAAPTPDAVTGNFVKTILKIPGGSGDQMTSFLKKVGFANTDGTPTAIYKKFRNEATRGQAAAESIRLGYAALYKRNEYAHELSDKDIKGIIIEETGQAADSSVASYILSCFKAMKSFANFSKVLDDDRDMSGIFEDMPTMMPSQISSSAKHSTSSGSAPIGLSLGYNINLNLPATTDIAVFNAIFKSLKQNLLSSDDV